MPYNDSVYGHSPFLFPRGKRPQRRITSPPETVFNGYKGYGNASSALGTSHIFSSLTAKQFTGGWHINISLSKKTKGNGMDAVTLANWQLILGAGGGGCWGTQGQGTDKDMLLSGLRGRRGRGR